MKNYQEGKPYIFISYPHKSRDVIIPILNQLDEYGYPLWWDKNIEYGSNYHDYIASYIENCSGVIAFLFDGINDSKYCINEIGFANELGKTIIPIRDTKVKIPGGLRMIFTNTHSFMVDDYADISVITNGLDQYSEFSQYRIFKETKAEGNTLSENKSYMNGPDYSNQTFTRVDFSKNDLRGANFSHATLYFCKFNGADLTNANFEGANLIGSRMIGCTLKDINLKDAMIDFVDFSHTEITESNIQATGAKTKHYPVDDFSAYNRGILLGKYQGEKVSCRALDYDQAKKELLIITENIVDCHRFHEHFDNISWMESDIHSWLNQEMKNEIEYNQNIQLVTSKILTEENPEYGTSGGEATEDELFLLSIQEVNQYFMDNEDRKARGTDSAKNAKFDGCRLYVEKTTGNSWWWLRSTGRNCSRIAYVLEKGVVYNYGNIIDSEKLGVRPALRIKLK